MLGGYLFGHFSRVDHNAISRLAMIILSPALIFSFLVRNPLSSTEIYQILISVLIFTIIMVIVTFLIFKMMGKKHLLTPALLSTVFPNTGNYGLPVLLLAYGEKAFSLGVVIVVINFILMYSLGIYFASLEDGNWKKAIYNILRLPTTYAAIAAIAVNTFHIEIPDYLYDPIKLVGDAMIPVVLLLLGIQLARTSFKGYFGVTMTSSILKILIAPIITIGIVNLLGIGGTVAKVIILQNSMPTAVVMTIIAVEYNARSEVVANVTFLSTILSFFSITGLLYWLNILY